jgi:hypothetical protein
MSRTRFLGDALETQANVSKRAMLGFRKCMMAKTGNGKHHLSVIRELSYL